MAPETLKTVFRDLPDDSGSLSYVATSNIPKFLYILDDMATTQHQLSIRVNFVNRMLGQAHHEYGRVKIPNATFPTERAKTEFINTMLVNDQDFPDIYKKDPSTIKAAKERLRLARLTYNLGIVFGEAIVVFAPAISAFNLRNISEDDINMLSELLQKNTHTKTYGEVMNTMKQAYDMISDLRQHDPHSFPATIDKLLHKHETAEQKAARLKLQLLAAQAKNHPQQDDDLVMEYGNDDGDDDVVVETPASSTSLLQTPTTGMFHLSTADHDSNL